MPLEEPSVSEKIIASEGAKRLLADPILRDVLDLLIQDATQAAVFHLDPAEREANRQLVLAISRLRGSLEVAATWQEQREAEERSARSFE
jgi:hypothetical protein